MTITCTGNGDQFVKENDNQTLEYPSRACHPLKALPSEQKIISVNDTTQLYYYQCHTVNIILWLNPTNTCNLLKSLPGDPSE